MRFPLFEMKHIHRSLTVFQPSLCLSWLLRASFSLLAARGRATHVASWWLLLGHVFFRSCSCWIPEHRFSGCEVWAELLLGHCGIFPDQGSNPQPLHGKREFLTTGSPGKPFALSSIHHYFRSPERKKPRRLL